MSRVIKFRIWDAKEKTLTTSDQVEYSTFDGPYLSRQPANRQRFERLSALFNTQMWTKNWNDCVIEQFTGLLDSKGIEIYEGDIVKQTKPRDSEVFAVGQVVIGLAFPHGEAAFYGPFLRTETLGDLRLHSTMMHLDATWPSQIIGNIHEHPSLLAGTPHP